MKRASRLLISLFMVIVIISSLTYTVFAVDTEISTTNLEFINIDYKKSDAIRVNLSNMELKFDVAPQVINGTTLVPFRAIIEALGMTVDWDDDKKIATGTNGTYKIIFPIGSITATVNGEEKTLLQPPQLISGRTMIPLRFLAESLGYHVVWVGQSNLILISDKNIVEWRMGGHDSDTLRVYEVKYINGIPTGEKRYTGEVFQSTITLNSTAFPLVVEKTYQIGITKNTASDKRVTYVSSNASIAKVNTAGLVTGVAKGTATITVTNALGESVTCTVTVDTLIGDASYCYFQVNDLNSPNGINLTWQAKNNNDKRINMFHVYITMYDAAGEPTKCEYLGVSNLVLNLSGPIEIGTDLSIKGLIAFSAACTKLVIDTVKFDYYDGTSETVFCGHVAYKS